MTESRELTAEDILGANDLETERVEMPEWNGHVFVRGLTGAERDAFEQSMIERKTRGRKTSTELKLDNIRASLVARSTVDASGRRLFSDAQVEALGAKSAAALDRLYEVASRLSGLGSKDVEELLEDFTDDPSPGSTTS